MKPWRSHEQRRRLVVVFSERLAALDDARWQRLYAQCAPLDDPAFSALLDRTMLRARSRDMLLPRHRPIPFSLRALRSVNWSIQVTLAFLMEVGAEFETGHRPQLRNRARGMADASKEDYFDAHRLIHNLLADHARSRPGVTAAVETAAHVLPIQDLVEPEVFEAMYRYVEPVIPFAEIASTADGRS